MNEFVRFEDAVQYAKEMRLKGYGAYVEEMYNFDGKYYAVITWKC